MRLSVLFVGFAMLVSCARKGPDAAEENSIDSTAVVFSNEQLKMSEIEWGKIQKKDISDIIECNGQIELPPQNNQTISPVMGGTVKDIHILPGMFIKKGDLLAILEHADYLTLQQDYFAARSLYDYQKEEYKRQGELTLEHATSLKKMQATEADFKTLEAKYYALRKQLQMLGLDPEKIKPETITSEVAINSPVTGYITNVYTNKGNFIGAGQKLCEIIDKSHLHLQLNLFEKDLRYIRQGQKITFNPAAIPDKSFQASVEYIGQAVNDENHSIPVHAHISSIDNDLKPGMFTTAKIMANPRYVYVLPVTSLIRKQNDFYTYVYNGKHFERTPVRVGKEMDQFMEIIPPDSAYLKNDFVIRGAYYLESEWEKNHE